MNTTQNETLTYGYTNYRLANEPGSSTIKRLQRKPVGRRGWTLIGHVEPTGQGWLFDIYADAPSAQVVWPSELNALKAAGLTDRKRALEAIRHLR